MGSTYICCRVTALHTCKGNGRYRAVTVAFSAGEGSIQSEFSHFSAVSRMGTFDIINDLSHEEAVKYCTCISHRLANNDVIVKLASMVCGHFSDLKLACNMLRMMSLHQVAESMFHKVDSNLQVSLNPEALEYVWTIATGTDNYPRRACAARVQ